MGRKSNKLKADEELKAKAVRAVAAGIDSDLKHYSSWWGSYNDPNPVMRSSKFISEGGYKVFEAMDADARIYDVMTTRKDQFMLRPWHIMSAIPGDEAQDFKMLFAWWVIDHIPNLATKKREQLSMQDYGYSVTEKIFDTQTVVIPDKTIIRNGKEVVIKGGTLENALIVVDLVNKPATAFDFDRYGQPLMAKVPPNLGNMISDYVITAFDYMSEEQQTHFMFCTHDPRNSSRKGWPLKATMFWDYLTKKATKIYRQIYASKYGIPTTKGTYNTTVQKEIDAFEEKLKGMQNNSYIMTPEGFAIEFVDHASKSGTVDVFQNILDYCDGNFAEVALGDRKAVESPADKEGKLRQEKLEADITAMDGYYNDDLIKQLIDANFVYDGYYPYQVTNAMTAAAIDKKLFQAQTFHNMGGDLSDSQLREWTGFRIPENEDDTIPGVKGQPSGDNQASGNNQQNQLIADGIKNPRSDQPSEQFNPQAQSVASTGMAKKKLDDAAPIVFVPAGDGTYKLKFYAEDQPRDDQGQWTDGGGGGGIDGTGSRNNPYGSSFITMHEASKMDHSKLKKELSRRHSELSQMYVNKNADKEEIKRKQQEIKILEAEALKRAAQGQTDATAGGGK